MDSSRSLSPPEAAIHGAVAAGVVDDFAAGQKRFGAISSQSYEPDNEVRPIYDEIYAHYRAITADNEIRDTIGLDLLSLS